MTLAFAVRGNFPWRRVPGYIIAQLVGAVLASGFLQLMYGGIINGATEPTKDVSLGVAMLTEAVLTLGLVSVIVGTASGARNVGIKGAIAVGAYITTNTVGRREARSTAVLRGACPELGPEEGSPGRGRPVARSNSPAPVLMACHCREARGSGRRSSTHPAPGILAHIHSSTDSNAITRHTICHGPGRRSDREAYPGTVAGPAWLLESVGSESSQPSSLGGRRRRTFGDIPGRCRVIGSPAWTSG